MPGCPLWISEVKYSLFGDFMSAQKKNRLCNSAKFLHLSHIFSSQMVLDIQLQLRRLLGIFGIPYR